MTFSNTYRYRLETELLRLKTHQLGIFTVGIKIKHGTTLTAVHMQDMMQRCGPRG